MVIVFFSDVFLLDVMHLPVAPLRFLVILRLDIKRIRVIRIHYFVLESIFEAVSVVEDY